MGIGNAKSPQDVRWLDRLGRAGGARRDRNVRHSQHQRFRSNTAKRDVQDTRYARAPISVHDSAIDRRNFPEETGVQGAYLRVIGFKTDPGQARRLPETGNLMRRERARAQPAFLPAPVYLRRKQVAQLATHEQRANSLRTVYLVTANREQIDIKSAHIKG